MLIGLLSDAHGNPLGLSRCLQVLDRAGATRIYFLGDAVGYLPGEAEVLRLLRERGVVCQRGNHEAMLLGDMPLDPERDAAYGLGRARERLAPHDLAQISAWPVLRELTVMGRRVLLVHGSPSDHLGAYVYPDSDLSGLADLGYDAIFLGNTHRPFVAELHRSAHRPGPDRGGPSRRSPDRGGPTRRGPDRVVVANVGSCGLPRDQGDLPACVTYDSVAHRCEVLRVRVPAADVLAQFGRDVVHPTVSECLQRSTAAPFGTVTTST